MEKVRLLIMGLPGSGKTTLADALKHELDKTIIVSNRLNADQVRKEHDDWDFSPAGRIRQAHRMREKADKLPEPVIITDFIAPNEEVRQIFDAHFLIWVDTIKQGRFEDTNKAFVPPDNFDLRVKYQAAEVYAKLISEMLVKKLFTF